MNADILAIQQYLKDPNTQMRVGRKLGRTLYLHLPSEPWDSDLCVGIVDSVDLAQKIVTMWNRHYREEYK